MLIFAINALLSAQDFFFPYTPYEGSIDQQYDQLFEQNLQMMISPDPIQEYLFFNPEFYLQDMILQRTVPGYIPMTPPSTTPSNQTTENRYKDPPCKKCADDCWKAYRMVSPPKSWLIECLEGCNE
jgi:hypothetical protein